MAIHQVRTIRKVVLSLIIGVALVLTALAALVARWPALALIILPILLLAFLLWRRGSTPVKVFLSHSGLDGDLAKAFGRQIKRELRERGLTSVVFNTSEPEHRFAELAARAKDRPIGADEVKAYERDLARYLKDHIYSSHLYFLLITRQSISANSQWVEGEILMAADRARQSIAVLFYPFVTDSSLLPLIPVRANRFNGVDLSDDAVVKKAFDDIASILNNHHVDVQASSP